MRKKVLFLLMISFLFLVMVNVKAETSVFEGDYSISSLASHYQFITFGLHQNNTSRFGPFFEDTAKGDLIDFNSIEGPVLVNGNFYRYDNGETQFADDSSYVSYIAKELGSNVHTDSVVATNRDYVNFEEMYVQVTNEQNWLVEHGTDLNEYSIVVDSPGIYNIKNTVIYPELEEYYSLIFGRGFAQKIYIDNYNPNEYYVFNIMSEYESMNYDLYIRNSGNPTYVSFYNYVDYNDYSGNIIFSYPNARIMLVSYIPGLIVAPKADVFLAAAEYGGCPYCGISVVPGSIFANRIVTDNVDTFYTPNQITKKLVTDSIKGYVVEYQDFSDDLYSGSYSLISLLQNYNVVTLGQKNYESNSKFLRLDNYKNGSAALFHIAGSFLVNGDLGVYPNNYPCSTGHLFEQEHAMRLDFESNYATESDVGGHLRAPYSTRYWGVYRSLPVYGSNHLFFTNEDEYSNDLINNLYYSLYNSRNFQFFPKDGLSYINYARLYENVVAQQANIKKGQSASPIDGVVHVEVGSNYVIDNINNVNEIILDNFENNKDQVTIITINDSGAIHFPKVSKNSDGYRGVITNDFYGKKEATYQYEYSTFVTDTYHGNVIWNVPNANFIELSEGAPFFGHLIAPNADVETPELHFAGSFIVNSLYSEGNTEAHFYPLTANKTNIYYTGDDGVQRVVAMRIGKALGEDYIKVDKVVLGDYDEYLEDLRREDSEGVPIINPYTFRTINVLIILLIVSMIILYARNKKKKIES